jgi:hypothetical protein
MPRYLSDAVTDAPVRICRASRTTTLRVQTRSSFTPGSLNDWLESMRKYFLKRLSTGDLLKLEELTAESGDLSNIFSLSTSIMTISKGTYSAYDR